MTQEVKLDLGWVENIVGKGENAGHQHFLLFQQCFPKASLFGLLKLGTVWETVKILLSVYEAMGTKHILPKRQLE